eukprot:1415908-Amphidinium_carterae.2
MRSVTLVVFVTNFVSWNGIVNTLPAITQCRSIVGSVLTRFLDRASVENLSARRKQQQRKATRAWFGVNTIFKFATI